MGSAYQVVGGCNRASDIEFLRGLQLRRARLPSANWVFDPVANASIFSKILYLGTNWQLLLDLVAVSLGGPFRIRLFRTEGTGTIYWDDMR